LEVAALGISVRAITRYLCSAESQSDLTLQFLRANIHGATRREHLALLSGNRLATHGDGCLGTGAACCRNPECLVPGSHGVVPDCTTEALNTHKTDLREITYPWHPWHGQRVLVRGEARRGGIVVLQCVSDELKGFPTLEIPEWMFDSNLCGRMKPAVVHPLASASLW
jgi:hypothetical protein